MPIKDKIAADERAGKVKTEAFIYSAVFNPLPAAGGLAAQINLQNDSDFLILATCLTVYSAPGVLVIDPDLTLAILDSGTGRQQQDAPIHVNNCTGTAQWPYIWPEPKIAKGGGTLTLTLFNNTAVATLVCSLAFHGYKIFYLQSVNRSV